MTNWIKINEHFKSSTIANGTLGQSIRRRNTESIGKLSKYYSRNKRLQEHHQIRGEIRWANLHISDFFLLIRCLWIFPLFMHNGFLILSHFFFRNRHSTITNRIMLLTSKIWLLRCHLCSTIQVEYICWLSFFSFFLSYV